MNGRVFAIALVAALSLTQAVASRPAQAQPPAPSDDDLARATKHYERGAAYFQEEEYDLALGEYQRAYELSKAPPLLFNIGLVHRAKGDHGQAVEAFESFLRLDPESPVAEEARGYVRDAKAALAQEESQDPAPGAAPESPGGAPAAAQAGPDPAPMPVPAAALQGRDAGASSPGRTLRWTGIGLAVGGAAALATGAIFGARARSLESEYSSHEGPWTDAELDRIGDGESAERNAIIASSLGGALLIAGGVSYWLGARAAARASSSSRLSAAPGGPAPNHPGGPRAPHHLSIAPSLAPGGAGLLVSGRF